MYYQLSLSEILSQYPPNYPLAFLLKLEYTNQSEDLLKPSEQWIASVLAELTAMLKAVLQI